MINCFYIQPCVC